MSSDDVTPLYLELRAEIFEALRKLAREAKKKTDICAELLRLRRLIGALGGKQLPPERREELRKLIREALRQGGCL